MSVDLPSPDRPLRIGTRGSPLALAQAHEARDRLMAAHGLPETAFAIVPIRTTGDRVQDRPLSELGGKGLFTREIEDALTAGRIDVAVHSMKDMPTLQPDGLAAERAFLAALDGSCLTPIAGLAELAGGRLRFRGEILRPDGSEALAHEVSGPAADGPALGAEAAAVLRGRAGPGFFAA